MTTVRRNFRPPSSSLVVPAVAALGTAVFFAWKPGVARSMLGSPRALGFGLVVGLLTVGFGLLLPRLRQGPWITGLVQAIPVAVALVLAVVPSFRNVTVTDPFPTAVPAAASGPAGSTAVPAPPREPAGAVTSSLRGIDHQATGTVLLLTTGSAPAGDESFLVRFEALDVEAGPDYHVYLVGRADATSPDGGTRLGALRGNRGAQNYPVPAGDAASIAADRPFTVLIWCRAFGVPIAAATIA
ncbi:DM13 domain-containing protein [Parafrankia elaeagni]|uniref:DM13 domain-containing protein n=1 Tax=Parafrankia elaeagni TaxID=222534 RepID=UPI00037806AA|nr:DM13 domain-containing protein [Parafrankia elaeagni]